MIDLYTTSTIQFKDELTVTMNEIRDGHYTLGNAYLKEGQYVDEDMIRSEQWKDFSKGKHTATLKDRQLIIQKTE